MTYAGKLTDAIPFKVPLIDFISNQDDSVLLASLKLRQALVDIR